MRCIWGLILSFVLVTTAVAPQRAHAAFDASWSAARVWDETLLNAIRRDQARPTVHARNLYHTAVAMWDCWAAYDTTAAQVVHRERATAADIEAARREAISYAMYRILSERFVLSPGVALSQAEFDSTLVQMGYDSAIATTEGNTPAALGNRVAASVIAFGLADGANEQNNYAIANGYVPVNEPLVVGLPSTANMVDPNRWQPLALDFFVDQNGVHLGAYPASLTPHWGWVTNFSLPPSAGTPEYSWYDPGPPPYLGGVGDQEFRDSIVQVIQFSSELTPDDGVMMDISPASMGNNTLGTNDGHGYAVNAVTGEPYAPQMVKRGDWARVLAEFWADGPKSETPPGHWNTVANYVADQPELLKKIGGVGPVVNDLEWDVKVYLALNGAVHDAGIACWGNKNKYDYARPISMVRYMGALGQSSNPSGPSYHPNGLPLVPGLIELITAESSAAGERHAALAEFVGEVAIYAWPGSPADPVNTYSGVKWVRARLWNTYQRPTFVTPPFPGYFSGHSTFSRSAAEVLTAITGSKWFPRGMGEFLAPMNQYLVFEDGPSTDVTFQWATYYDAADNSGLSRLYGSIHVRSDDFAGRRTGEKIGKGAWAKAQTFYNGKAEHLSADKDGDGQVSFREVLRVVQFYNSSGYCCETGTEDGFAPGVGQRESCVPYTSDYDTQDWQISLSELLRVIQYYQSGCYTYCPDENTEDGFCSCGGR